MDDPARTRILVVEDEWIIAYHLEAMLMDLGYEVIGPAPTVDEAMALIKARPPDAAVLDVSLACGRSFPVAEEMRRRGTPFVFITGYVAADLPEAFQGHTILNKPISLLDLKCRLAAMTMAACSRRLTGEDLRPQA
ncbi:MAG TPA: response regulator [Caulobacteraceae bacterium]|jgi:CheY-like chemotaxis protein|nr:response regulator [Caulobacteraceae bacterium]